MDTTWTARSQIQHVPTSTLLLPLSTPPPSLSRFLQEPPTGPHLPASSLTPFSVCDTKDDIIPLKCQPESFLLSAKSFITSPNPAHDRGGPSGIRLLGTALPLVDSVLCHFSNTLGTAPPQGFGCALPSVWNTISHARLTATPPRTPGPLSNVPFSPRLSRPLARQTPPPLLSICHHLACCIRGGPKVGVQLNQ